MAGDKLYAAASIVSGMKIFFALALLVPVLVLAQGPSAGNINVNIPGSYDPKTPVGILGNFYQFALMLGGLIAFGAIVWGGIRYATSAGNPSGQSDARDQITQALLGLFLLVGAYIVLNFINPGLTTLSLPGLENIVIPTSTRAYPIGACAPVRSGPASAANLQNTCFGANADKAAGIANAESGGDPFAESRVDVCRPQGDSVSWGLFQINISAHRVGNLNCPAAFDRRYTGSNPNCTVTNRALYDQCVQAAQDPATNIQTACRISNNGTNWSAWGANRICGF